jgi:hypothetical protein
VEWHGAKRHVLLTSHRFLNVRRSVAMEPGDVIITGKCLNADGAVPLEAAK